MPDADLGTVYVVVSKKLGQVITDSTHAGVEQPIAYMSRGDAEAERDCWNQKWPGYEYEVIPCLVSQPDGRPSDA